MENLVRKFYLSIGENNEYLTTPKTKKGKKVPWSRLDSNIKAFYTEVVHSVMSILEGE